MPSPTLIPGSYTPWFAKGFGKFVRVLMARKFRAVRVERSGIAELPDVQRGDLDVDARPLIVLLSHSSWWDPLVAALLARQYAPSRSSCSPMDAVMLRKLGFFRKVGMFGLDPDNPRSMRALVDYTRERFAREPRPTLWITPQGTFADVRTPLEVRPGAAAVAHACPTARVISLAIEYGFWLDPKPEVFLRWTPVPAPENPTIRAWLHAMHDAMSANAAALAQGVMSRDPSRFVMILGKQETPAGATSIRLDHRREAGTRHIAPGPSQPAQFVPAHAHLRGGR